MAVVPSTTTTTPRQTEVVRMHDEGMRNKDIAKALGIHAGTVSNALNEGLEALGRGAERNTPTGTGHGAKAGPKVRGLMALVQDELDRARASLDNIMRPVRDAKSVVTSLKQDGISVAEAHVQALRAKAEALNAEADAVIADPTPFVDAAKVKATEALYIAEMNADARKVEVQAGIDVLEATLSTLPTEGA